MKKMTQRQNQGELERFKAAKENEIKRLIADSSSIKPFNGSRLSFTQALKKGLCHRNLAIIAEYKRASPSLGDIDLNLSPEQAAANYHRADALSILTEETYFKGSLSYIERALAPKLPILRKDFIFHPLQIAATAATAASAVLLIVRLTPQLEQLKLLMGAALEGGLEVVVEVFDEIDLETARLAEAKIIQVNRRDLCGLTLQSEKQLSLIEKFPPLPGELWIAASGLKSAADLKTVVEAGFSAALIGSALMASSSPSKALGALLTNLEEGFKRLTS
ncbi:MAG: indole-3-glycerol-phosphate synthase [Deltaproteobacteria bacterium]|jgi:indole-3-glycerol phosphate synthase|nr:indole-3-glycerol-phosphate synthase [Deltaproteobacteria bacterium]